MSTERLKSKVDLDHLKKPITGNKNIDFKLLPLLGTSETVVDWMSGETVWEPFGAIKKNHPCNLMRSCVTSYTGGALIECLPVDNLCSREGLDANKYCGKTMPCCFPLVPYLLTCALRPFQTRKDVIITDMSVLRFARTQNFGFCGCLRFFGVFSTGPCTSNDCFIISWETIESFSGFSIRIDAEGEENITRRLCRGNCIGRTFCPIGHSQLEIGMDFKGKYQYATCRGGQGGSSSDTNKVWIKDLELAENTKMLAGVQIALFDKMQKTRGTAGAVVRDEKKKRSLF